MCPIRTIRREVLQIRELVFTESPALRVTVHDPSCDLTTKFGFQLRSIQERKEKTRIMHAPASCVWGCTTVEHRYFNGLILDRGLSGKTKEKKQVQDKGVPQTLVRSVPRSGLA